MDAAFVFLTVLRKQPLFRVVAKVKSAYALHQNSFYIGKWWVIVHLEGKGRPKTQGPLRRGSLWLPWAWVRDTKRKLRFLANQPSGYFLLLVFFWGGVSSDGVLAGSLRKLKRDFRALGQLIKGVGAQTVFSSILLFAGNGEGRDRKCQLGGWAQRVVVKACVPAAVLREGYYLLWL